MVAGDHRQGVLEFFLNVAREVCPHYGFAAMSAAEYGTTIAFA
jgi:hypothetical protein